MPSEPEPNNRQPQHRPKPTLRPQPGAKPQIPMSPPRSAVLLAILAAIVLALAGIWMFSG